MAQYNGGRCEVESKYTTFVDLTSRAVPPRIDMSALVPHLNSLEVQHSAAGAGAWASVVADHRPTIGVWMSEGLEDPGPVLRLQALGRELTHAARYGHPSQRSIEPSAITPSLLREVIVTHFQQARAEMESGAGAWLRPSPEWRRGDIAEFNRRLRPPAAPRL